MSPAFGRIGQKLAQMMRPLVKRVLYYDVQPIEGVDWATAVDLDSLWRESDLMSLHLPLIAATRHLVNHDTLKQMKDTAIVVNAARGALVHPGDLAQALNNGQLGGAGLDVFDPEVLPADSPLRTAKNVVLTSHTAWYSEQSLVDARQEAMDSIIGCLKGC